MTSHIRSTGTEQSESHARTNEVILYVGVLDLGVGDVVDQQARLIERVVRGGNDSLQVVIDEVFR